MYARRNELAAKISAKHVDKEKPKQTVKSGATKVSAANILIKMVKAPTLMKPKTNDDEE